MKVSGIYEILNTVNGKRYIGSAVCFSHRWRNHKHYLRQGKHHSSKLQRAWSKYSESIFVFRPILLCSRKNLVMYEQLVIDDFKPDYNTAKSVLNPMLGRKHSKKTKLKMSAVQIGHPVSDEARRNMSKGQVGNKNSLGRIHPPEIRLKMSKAQRGKKQSAETIAHRAAVNTGKRRSPAQRTNISVGRIAANLARKLSTKEIHT